MLKFRDQTGLKTNISLSACVRPKYWSQGFGLDRSQLPCQEFNPGLGLRLKCLVSWEIARPSTPLVACIQCPWSSMHDPAIQPAHSDQQQQVLLLSYDTAIWRMSPELKCVAENSTTVATSIKGSKN